ncbi:hypothetical protein COV12_03515 [Candidatus Woesearchaeota archaeon CG10_big_fil_rev_8_21_14_0_10_32_24]|nr:MAG: hypothetical protein COV12_03515 [Candidatus Woesearchaeota archaeon CG10_big_fil_rev_8_21_14_0_10_32_24]
MGIFQDLLGQALSERTLGRRERRVIDQIIINYDALKKQQQEISAFCIQSPLNIKKLEGIRNKLTQNANKIISQTRNLMNFESAELDKDINVPHKILMHLIPLIEKFLDFVKKEGNVDKETHKKLQTLLEGITNEFTLVTQAIENVLKEIELIFSEELNKPGSAYAHINIEQLMNVGDQFETQKLALSQKITSLIKKVNQFQKELERISKSLKKEKASPLHKLLSLEEMQKKRLTEALTLLSKQDLNQPLSKKVQQDIRKIILDSLNSESGVIAEMEHLKIPERITLFLSHYSGKEKKQMLTYTNKLRCYKTASGVYPFEFWLGEKRAQGFLNANDPKNLALLKTLLSEGMLHSDYGMLSERITTTESLIADGILNNPYDEFINYLEQYKPVFVEVMGYISKRSEMSKSITSLVGGAIYHIDQIIHEVKLNIDHAIDKQELLDKQENSSAREAASARKEIKDLEQERKRVLKAALEEEKSLKKERSEVVVRMGALHGEIVRRDTRSRFMMKRMMCVVALAILPIITAGAVTMHQTSRSPSGGLPRAEVIMEANHILGSEQSRGIGHRDITPTQEDFLASLKQKLSENDSPVQVLYHLTENEMIAFSNQGKISLMWTLKNFSISKFSELSQEVHRLQKNMNHGIKLDAKEVQFLRNYYYLLAIGGKVKGMEEASKLLIHYIQGSGKDLEVLSDIYKDSEAVKIVQKSMIKYVEQQYALGNIKSSGILNSSDIYHSQQSFKGNSESYGGIARGESGDKKLYVLAEQDNAALKNMNNRFILTCSYTVKKNQIYFVWSVQDDYSFEAKKGYETILNIPGTGQHLVVSDALSASMTLFGAKPFNHNASWSSIETIKG